MLPGALFKATQQHIITLTKKYTAYPKEQTKVPTSTAAPSATEYIFDHNDQTCEVE